MRGNALVTTLFFISAFSALAALWVDVARGSIAAQRAQALGDAAALSSLRVTAEALETIAARWQEFGGAFGAASAEGVVELPSSLWAPVREKADELKRAISGYQGRSTAIVKVVAEANGASKDVVDAVATAGAQIGLAAERARLLDENGRVVTLDAAWYSRKWTLDPVTGARTDRIGHIAQSSIRAKNGAEWPIIRETRARLVWNAETPASGNGGYPRTWSDALLAGHLTPHRWPFFRATLDPQ